MNKIQWSEQFKIRTRRNASRKHEIIKLLIVLNLIEKYKRNTYWIRIYTEHSLGSNTAKITDVYFENVKTKEIICYEIQRRVTTDWLNETREAYENYERMYFRTDWVLVREDDLPDDIDLLNDKIKEIIV